MLQFILGGSGCGKTTYIHNILHNECNTNNNAKLLLIVPDQSAVDTEKTLLQKFGAKILSKIDVLGFGRLCDRIIADYKGTLPDTIEDTDLALVMSMALDGVCANLELFKKRKNSDDLITIMLNTIKEYKKCAVSPAKIREVADLVSSPILKSKLTDTALVYDAYNAVLENTYTEPLKKLEIVKNILSENNIFKDYIIAVDSFANFTAVELDIISILMRESADMYFSLTLENFAEDKKELFFTSHKTYNYITDIAKNNGVAIKPNVELIYNYRAKNEDIKFLQKNIFRLERESSTDPAPNIKIYSGETIYDECDFVASEIKRLIVKEGYLLNDFAILTRDMSAYNGVLQNSLNKYNLRFFNDCREALLQKPLVRLIFYIFDTVSEHFAPESILQLLKTGLIPAKIEDISNLENYIYSWSITANEICRPFTKNPSSISSKKSENDLEQLAKLEQLRQFIVNPLIKFKEICKDATATTITASLYNLLIELKVDECVVNLGEIYRNKGQITFAEEQTRLWEHLVNCLDKMVMIIGGKAINLKRYSRLLRLQLENADIGIIPRGIDLITVASVDRSKIGEKKVVFLLGAIDRLFPLLPKATGLFSNVERTELTKIHNLKLDYNCEDLAKQEDFFAYTAISATSEKLYITTYNSNLNGDSFMPSVIIEQTMEILPNTEVISLSPDLDIKRKLYSEKSAFEFYASVFKSESIISNQLKEYFCSKQEYLSKLNAMGRSLKPTQTQIANKDNIKKIFGDNLDLSASQIDKFYKCPFNYLCDYGFRIKKLEKFNLDTLQHGTFMHYILQKFFTKFRTNILADLDDKAIDEAISEFIKEYIGQNYADIEDKRFIYLLSKIKINATVVVKHIIGELLQSDFEPKYFEYQIGKSSPDIKYILNLENGSAININGSIDRVDTMVAGDGSEYVRIIDYKTGDKSINVSDIIYGINLQMLIYLSAICRNTDMQPAGAIYMPAVSEVLKTDGNDVESLLKEIKNKYKMNGLFLNRIEVLVGMDKELGKYININNKNTEYYKQENILTNGHFELIFDYIDAKIKDMGNNVYNGNFSPVPLKSTSKDSCEYCCYSDICMVDDNSPCIKFETAKKEDALNKIEHELNDKEGD